MKSNKRRHANVVNISEVTDRTQTKGRFTYRAKRLWPEASGKSLACSWFEVPPGKQAFPHHFHSAIEEAIFILDGHGTARIGSDKIEVGPGDYMTFPAGPETAHSLHNTGKIPLQYLAMSTVQSLEIVVYPDSKKIAFASGIDSSKGILRSEAWVKGLIREQPSVDYFDGENTEE